MNRLLYMDRINLRRSRRYLKQDMQILQELSLKLAQQDLAPEARIKLEEQLIATTASAKCFRSIIDNLVAHAFERNFRRRQELKQLTAQWKLKRSSALA